MGRASVRAWLISLLVLAGSGAASAATHVVDPDGTGDVPSIQAAIDAADPGDIIELTDGTFIGPGDRDIDFLGKAVTVRSQSGDPDLCIIDCEGSAEEPHRGVVFMTNETTDSVLQGITILDGFHVVGPQHDGRGGAVLCSGGFPRVVDCRFVSCEASGTWGSDGYGGAVWGSGEFVDCEFIDNRAQDGGGAVWSTGEASFTGCRFVDNYCTFGGAVYLSGGNVRFTGCDFEGNDGDGDGGAVTAQAGAAPVFTRCRFLNNTTHVIGGFTPGGAFAGGPETTAAFEDCIFLGSSAGTEGGAVDCGSPTFVGCLFAGNRSHDNGFGSYGGAVYCWGPASFERCTFADNEATHGAGISWTTGGGTLTLARTILAFNRIGDAVNCPASVDLTVTCTDIHGNPGGDWTDTLSSHADQDGNFSLDPLFCDAASDDWQIHAGLRANDFEGAERLVLPR